MLYVEKSVTDRHIRFIDRQGSGRIRTDTFEAYCDKPEDVIVVSYITPRGNIIALSAALLEGRECNKAITIVHKDYRRQGLGSLVLALRLSLLKDFKICTIVAEDNIASNRLVNKCGMTKIGEQEQERKTGLYTALIYAKGGDNDCKI